MFAGYCSFDDRIAPVRRNNVTELPDFTGTLINFICSWLTLFSFFNIKDVPIILKRTRVNDKHLGFGKVVKKKVDVNVKLINVKKPNKKRREYADEDEDDAKENFSFHYSKTLQRFHDEIDSFCWESIFA